MAHGPRRRDDPRERARSPASSRRFYAFARWRLLAPAAATARRWAVDRLQWWPLDWLPRSPRRARPPRIAYYHHAFPVLSETFVQREVEALRRCGLAVEVIAHETVGEEFFGAEAKRLAETTTYVPRLGPTGLRSRAAALARRRPFALVNLFLYAVLRRHRPQKPLGGDRELFYRAVYLAGVLEARAITHLHCPFAGPGASIALIASRLAGIPFTVQARASDIHRASSAGGLRGRLVHADFVVTNARYNEGPLRALLRGGSPPIHVIYEGIEPSRFPAPAARAEPGEVARILSVARLVEPKGLEHLIRACRILRDRGRALTCAIVGGEDEAEVDHALGLRKLRRALRLEDTVTFLGAEPFDRVLERYRAADVFVLPAVTASDGRRDVTPNVLIEAMAMKLPLVSTRSGAIPEIVEDGVSGLLVAPGDANALADAVLRLLDDPALRERLADAGRRRVEERFDVDRNARAYVALLAGNDE